MARQCGRSQAQELIDNRVGGRCPEAARHLGKRGEIGEDHRHVHEAALLQMSAAPCAAIGVARASTNASPPQENGGEADQGNAADQAVGGKRRSFDFYRRAHCNASREFKSTTSCSVTMTILQAIPSLPPSEMKSLCGSMTTSAVIALSNSRFAMFFPHHNATTSSAFA